MAIKMLRGVTVAFEQQVYMWGDCTSLKIRVVTNPRASDLGRCLTAEHINDCCPSLHHIQYYYRNSK